MAPTYREPTDYVTCKHCRRDYKAITVAHLRRIHGYEGDHPVLEYKDRFQLQSAMCLESRNKIGEEKDSFWAKRGQHWTHRKLIAEIRRTHRGGKRLSKRDVPVRVYEAGRRLFGSWEQALKQAGLDYQKVTGNRPWTPARVVAAIRELADRGIPLSATHVKQEFPQLYHGATKQFPSSWAKALRAAGFDPDEHKMPRGIWNKSEAENWVRQRVAKGCPILARDAPDDLPEFVRRRLRMSWTGFVESLGIPYPGIKKRRDWTEAKVRSEIRRWKAQGRPLNYRAVKDRYQALIHQARKFFGSWDRARAEAGV